MRIRESYETGAGSFGGSTLARTSFEFPRRRRWMKPAVRVSPLPEVVRGAQGSAPDTFGQSGNLPGG